MSKEYIIIELNDTSSKYCAVVISLTYHRIDWYLSDLLIELKRKYIVGYVIFDLLLTNGDKQRYYETYFNGKQFNHRNFLLMLDVPKNINVVSNNTFSNNIKLIESSLILSDKSKKLLTRYILSASILQ
jgi:hypothetical protein